jgi:hypothetical protein
MLRPIEDMPAGTLGSEAEVEEDDWRDTVEPLLRETIAAGSKVRLLYLLGPRGREVEGRAGDSLVPAARPGKGLSHGGAGGGQGMARRRTASRKLNE